MDGAIRVGLINKRYGIRGILIRKDEGIVFLNLMENRN
jgi:hypothetical protein